MIKIKLILNLFFLSFVVYNYVEGTKLNYPRVLLPIFDKISINFTLQVIGGGCFKWTSSRYDLIAITPLFDDVEHECSHRATVTVLTRERRRNTAIVLAEDMTTGESQRCDVILDVINKLGVHTTTRQLYLEEAPETFELRAEDSQGNAFTTLDGVEFSWSITSLNPDNKNWLPPLRFISFSESIYHEVPANLENFDALGIRGYMVLLEGINTGTAKVTVNMPYQEYNSVPAIEVYINVLANIILEPSDVHILPDDVINFRILQLKMGKLHEITLNSQYFLEVKNAKIGSITGNALTGHRIGRTTVILRDRNVPNDGSFIGDRAIQEASIPSAQVTVVEPYKLGISLLPYNNWITVEGEQHVIAFDLYTKNDQKITLGSKFTVESEVERLKFYVLSKNNNGSRLFGEAVQAGTSSVYGTFKKLKAQAELQIYTSLKLTPTKVILPYDLNIVKTQKIQFKAIGGDGFYLWQTLNPKVMQVSQSGLATTIIRETDRKSSHDFVDTSGNILSSHSVVKVALAKNQKIYRQADIYFLPPVRLEIIKYNFETALKDYVRLHVAMYAFINGTEHKYSKCENVIFDFEFSNQIFQLDYSQTNIQPVDGACQVVSLRGIQIGLTHLIVSYKFQERVLRDEATLSVFEPLYLLNPIENEIILPIGASRHIIYSNGQQKIFTLEADLVKDMVHDKNLIQLKNVELDTSKGLYAFTVLCRDIGDTNLTFNLYNSLSERNFKAYVSTIVTSVYCVKPRFLNLYATEKLRSSCPLEMKHSLLHLKDRDDKFEVEVEVQDAKNRKLMNISSLIIDWEFSSDDQHVSNHKISYALKKDIEMFENLELPTKDILFVKPLVDLEKNFRIKGSVKNYNDVILHNLGIYPEYPPFAVLNVKSGSLYTPHIENEISFKAVNGTLFPSDHLNIFMSQNSIHRIPISQGSGYYDLSVSEEDIIGVSLDSTERNLIIKPLRIGNTHIELVDRCLMKEPAVMSISVVSIGSIRVNVADRVERLKSLEAIVTLYDTNSNILTIDHSNLKVYALSDEIYNPGILKIYLGDQDNLHDGEIRFIVTGNNLGETKVVFHSGSGTSMISSEPVNIQVFSPLRLHPRNSTLVVGANIQIYHSGGPQPETKIIYEIHDNSVITIDSAIVTGLKLGVTKITGKSVMINKRTGKEIVISQDTVEVHVAPLVSIEVRTPLSEIRSGAIMPATIWGVPDLSPMVLGTLANMRITWSTNQPDVIDIFNIFADAGIEYSDNNLISVRIKALNPGKARIQCSVQLPNNQKINSFVEVIVFKILELEAPRHITMDWILVAPRSTIQLKANLDDVGYKPDSQSKSIVKVSPDGIVRTHDTLGRDLIIAKTPKQTLPIGIEVKNVHYILAALEYPTIKLRHRENRIPKGMNFILKVSMHDNLGNEFSHNIENANSIKYELAHKDVVDVQIRNNWTIALNLPRETNNMIVISLKDTTGVKYAEDYIKLSVADSPNIFPSKTIFSVGDIICFDSPLSLASVWKSTDDQIVSIDPYTGIARVLGNRFKLGEKIVVTNGDKASGSFIKYDVEVRDADVIQFSKSFDIFSGQNYRAHLVLRNHLQLDKFTNLVAKNISTCSKALENMPAQLFECHLASKQALGQEMLRHYRVIPAFDLETGSYICQVDLNTTFNDVLNIVKTNDVHFELEARLANGLKDSIALKFVPGIKVAPDSLINANLVDQELTVSGLDKVLQKVTIKASDAYLLKVHLMTKAHGLLKYKIKVAKPLKADQQLHLTVESPTTMQTIQVPVIGVDKQPPKTCAKQVTITDSGLQTVLSNIGLVSVILILIGIVTMAYMYHGAPSLTEPSPEIFEQSDESPKNSFFDGENISPIGNRLSTPVLMQQSPYFDRSDQGRFSPTNEPQVYGDSKLFSPRKRINRRYL